MEFFDAVEQRRSVKAYDPAFKISTAEVEQMLSAAIKSPTSFNIQHWRFVQVADPALRAEVGAAAWGQEQVTEASLLFVITADVQAWAKSPERYWRDAPAEAQQALLPMIGQFYGGRDQVQRDEAMRSVGMAAQTLMLAAKAMGYDSCPMIGFDADKVAELIKLPQDHVIGMLLAVGKAIKPASVRGGQLALSEVLIRDRFAA